MNVLNKPLVKCDRSTGWLRDGYCSLSKDDRGSHTVCAVVTKAFLLYTLRMGNDLITPGPNFPGLKPGDKWCLCVFRWIQAYRAGVAPPIVLESTDKSVLSYVPLEILKQYSFTP